MKFESLKKFGLKALLLLFLVIAFVEASYRIITKKVSKNAFPAALIDKHNYARSVTSPKVILVGGSNLAFGINSAMLSKTINMPVCNFALLAPLGIEFILSDATDYINKGDIVIMSFEYDINVKGDMESQLYVADFIPQDRHYVSDTSGLTGKIKSRILHRLHAPVKIETILEKPTIDDPFSIYFRGAFNKEGDIISHINNYKGNVHDQGGPVSSFSYIPQLESMNSFTKKFRDKGARVFFLYPTVAQSFYNNTSVAIAKMEKKMDKDSEAQILSKPEHSVYPDSSCFDTIFHLNGSARDIHTERVAKALLRIGI